MSHSTFFSLPPSLGQNRLIFLSGFNGLLGMGVGCSSPNTKKKKRKRKCTKPTKGQFIVESARSGHPEGGSVFGGLRGESAPASSFMHGEQKTEK